MDPSGQNIPLYVFVVVSLLVLGLVAVVVYAWVASRVAKSGGKVAVDKFGFPDLVVGGLLAGYFIVLSISGFTTPPKPVHESELIDSAMITLIVVATLASFLHYRGINLPVQFGLRALRIDKVIGIAFLLLLAFYPMMICASAVMERILGADARQQELITFFSDATQKMDYRTVLYTVITGVLVAPVSEEFIFRGYLHGILKRYLGVTAGIVLNAALFAAVHVNVTSFPALFIFAVCLTLAYEFTGSILVNMCMHSLFNLCTLAFVFYVSSHPQ